jgi:hypothetical protein
LPFVGIPQLIRKNKVSDIKHILPPLRTDHQIKQLGAAGKWEGENDYAILGRVADGLKVARRAATGDDLVSIPDIWAQVDTFTSALIDKNHRMNPRAISEWRALLAVFALQAFHDYSLSTQVFSLREKRDTPYRHANGQAATDFKQHFGWLVEESAPKRVLAKGMHWDDIALLSVNGKIVALIVPSTLVCTSRSLKADALPSIPWIKDGRLADPCSEANLQPEEYAALSHYLGKLIVSLENEIPDDPSLMNGVLRALGAFKDETDLRYREESKRQRSTLSISGFSPYQQRVALPNHPSYISLASAWKIDAGQSVVFDTVLLARREFERQIKGAIIVDEEIASYAGRSAAEIRIWDMLSLDRLSENENLIDEVRDGAAAEGYFCLTPDDIFSTKLCKIRGDQELERHPVGFRQFLLPIMPTLLILLSPDELSHRIKIQPIGDAYEVSISLSLQSSHGGVIEHVLRRSYAAEDIVERELPNSCSLWPNFRHPNWNLYFLYYVGYLPIHFSIHQVFAVDEIRMRIEGARSLAAKADACANMQRSGDSFTSRLGLLETAALNEIHTMLSAPEALLCDAALDNEIQDFVPVSDRTPLGLLLFPKLEAARISENRWSFGVDFGTTNTSVYFREENDGPRPLNLSDRIVQPYLPEERTYDKTLQDFIPARSVPVPFMTILRDRSSGIALSERSPLMSSHIYFVNQPVNALEEIVGDAARMLKFNLKWSQRPEDRQRVQLYLGQVAMEALAEAMSMGAKPQNIDWSFSHPEAFSPSHLRAFRDISKGAVRQVMRLVENSDDPITITNYRSESLSAALYFISKKSAAFTESVVTFDIGGHTTDISIWQSRRLIWRDSVQIGGQHIFIEFLKQNPFLMDELSLAFPALQESVNILHEILDDPERLGSGIEILVNNREYAHAFSEGFAQVDGTVEGKILRNLSELAIAGLLYYTGRVIADLAERKLFDTRSASHIKVCLGGRTSQLYKVLFGGDFGKFSDAAQILDIFTDAASGAVDGAAFVFTDAPKHEVAFGLLVETAGGTNLDVEHRHKEVIVGEELTVGDQIIPDSSVVSSLDPGKEWRVATLPKLKDFLAELRKHRGLELPLDEETEHEIVGMVNSALVDTQERLIQEAAEGIDAVETNVRGESSLVEPVFITTLRSLFPLVINGDVTMTSHH